MSDPLQCYPGGWPGHTQYAQISPLSLKAKMAVSSRSPILMDNHHCVWGQCYLTFTEKASGMPESKDSRPFEMVHFHKTSSMRSRLVLPEVHREGLRILRPILFARTDLEGEALVTLQQACKGLIRRALQCNPSNGRVSWMWM